MMELAVAFLAGGSCAMPLLLRFKSQRDDAVAKLSRLTDRDARGRFVKR